MVVACTHLDHITEEEREVQLSHVLQSLESFAEGKPVAILGDFNALTRSDYSSSEWDAIEAINKENGWKPPRYGCLDLLAEAGYQDAWLLSKTATSEETKGWTAHVSDPRYRIDYGFLGSGLVKEGRCPVRAVGAGCARIMGRSWLLLLQAEALGQVKSSTADAA